MIDTIVLSPTIHIALGVLVMVATLAATAVTGLLAWRRPEYRAGLLTADCQQE